MSDNQQQVDEARSAFKEKYAEINLTELISLPPFPTCGGGYADIYSATLATKEGAEPTRVALKVLRVSMMSVFSDVKLKTVKRLRQEISVWRRLEHSNVQPLLGLWWKDEWTLPVMVSTWQQNGNLVDYLRRRSGAMPASELHSLRLDLIDDVLNGLSYLHTKKVIHADIKGANVLVSSSGTALLCDFGVSWTSIKASVSFSTRESARGTDAFQAPELLGIDESQQEDATIPYSFASDVWAFGCLFFEVMTGTVPWHGKLSGHVFKAMSRKELFAHPATMDSRHWDFVQFCCAFNIADRPATDAIRPVLKELRTM